MNGVYKGSFSIRIRTFCFGMKTKILHGKKFSKHRQGHRSSQDALLLLVAARSVFARLILSKNYMQCPSMESSGYCESFSSDVEDYDLEDDDFSSANMSFNGRLVISGCPSTFPVTGGKVRLAKLEALLLNRLHTDLYNNLSSLHLAYIHSVKILHLL